MFQLDNLLLNVMQNLISFIKQAFLCKHQKNLLIVVISQNSIEKLDILCP